MLTDKKVSGIQKADWDIDIPVGEITSSEVTVEFYIRDIVPENPSKFGVLGGGGSNFYYILSENGNTGSALSGGWTNVELWIDDVDYSASNRDQVHDALIGSGDHKVWIKLSNYQHTAHYLRIMDYKNDSFNVASAQIHDLKLDNGSTGSWDSHWPLADHLDVTDQIGTAALTITAR